MPPSAEQLMSSKKMPQSVGEILWPGWSTCTSMVAAGRAVSAAIITSALARNFDNFIFKRACMLVRSFIVLRLTNKLVSESLISGLRGVVKLFFDLRHECIHAYMR